MTTLAIDIETYSSVDLQKCGVYAYAASPDFEILLFGYAFDDGPVDVIDLTAEKLPKDLIDAIYDPEIVKTAFNASFERTCLSAYFREITPPEQWSDTAVVARELGLPNSLEQVGIVLGLPDDKKKAKTGRALIRYFSVPCKPTKVNGGRTRNLPEHDLNKWHTYIEYNRQDVEAERAIRKKLSHFQMTEEEQALWIYDQHINDRGVGVDLEFASHAVKIDQIIKDRLLQDAKELTGLENPKSTAQLKNWIANTAGLDEIDSLNKKNIDSVRAKANNRAVDAMLDIRVGLSKTSTEKYHAMLRTAGKDNRIRGLTQFYGASRTGRWAGRLVQMQNLPQNKMPDRDLDIARQLVKTGDLSTLEICFDDVAGTLSQLIRTAFIPKQGCRFIVADFSAIEARVIAWLAGESWRMDVFHTHGKIYEASAEQMFHLPPGSVKKGDPMRQKGKIAELALGYGGSVGALKSMGALEMGLAEEELKPLVNSWRAANPAITKFWWDTDAAARKTIQTKMPTKLPHGMGFYKKGPLLKLVLPNGRALSYVKPAIVEDSITYEGTLQSSGAWGRIESYGPKIVENIVQATARDCLAVAISRLEDAGFPVVFHVHDEVICEVPEGVSSAEEIGAIMSEPISWAPDLPLRADAYECSYYRKA